jgi:hypothetical protein
VGRTLSRVAGIVFAGALVTFAATPAALAEDGTPTSTTETTTSTSETTTTTAPTTTETTTPSTPATTTETTSTPATTGTTRPEPPTPTSTSTEPPKDDDYQDNTGHGFIGLGGEGVLVIACASGKLGAVDTENLEVTGGPDQDESDGRYWNYSVRVATPPTGTTSKFSWTCDGVAGNGIVEFQQEEPPTTSVVPSSTAPVTTATSATAVPGHAAPKAQVKVAPRGGVETGFGGTAR